MTVASNAAVGPFEASAFVNACTAWSDVSAPGAAAQARAGQARSSTKAEVYFLIARVNEFESR